MSSMSRSLRPRKRSIPAEMLKAMAPRPIVGGLSRRQAAMRSGVAQQPIDLERYREDLSARLQGAEGR